MTRWLVNPWLSVALLAVWLLLNGSMAPAQLLLGSLIAAGAPLLMDRSASARHINRRRVFVATRLLGRVTVDIVRSNLELAVRILGSEAGLRPRYVWVPISLNSAPAIAVLGSIITLTPGTVSIDFSSEQRRLLVHVFDLDAESDLVTHIKTRYEQLLQEIFE